MKPLASKFLWIVAGGFILVIIGYGIGLTVSGNAILAALSTIAIMGLLIWLLNSQLRKVDPMEVCRKYAIEWWKRNYDEDLTKDDSLGMATYFDNITPHYGFSFKRISGERFNQHMAIVVAYNQGHCTVVKCAHAPGPEIRSDPFKMLEGYTHRSPVPIKFMGETMLPKVLDNMPAYGRRKRSGTNINIGQVGHTSEPSTESDEEEKR